MTPDKFYTFSQKHDDESLFKGLTRTVSCNLKRRCICVRLVKELFETVTSQVWTQIEVTMEQSLQFERLIYVTANKKYDETKRPGAVYHNLG